MTRTPDNETVQQEGNVVILSDDAPVTQSGGAVMSDTNPTMTKDAVFDQLMDESRVVTGGTGSSLPSSGISADTETTGYSAGVGSGTGERSS